MEEVIPLEERKKLANKEYKKVREWLIEDGKKRLGELEEKGSFHGFTSEREVCKELYREFAKKCLEIFDKYDLPNKPKFKE